MCLRELAGLDRAAPPSRSDINPRRDRLQPADPFLQIRNLNPGVSSGRSAIGTPFQFSSPEFQPTLPSTQGGHAVDLKAVVGAIGLEIMQTERKSTRLNSSHKCEHRLPSSA